MKCKNCNQDFDVKFNFCPNCGAKKQTELSEKYKNVYGVWSVTTEGDCEGRDIKTLGTHEGYIDDIAFKLADKCYYSLCFSRVEEKEEPLKKEIKEVNITLAIKSGTWDFSPEERAKEVAKIFKGRPVTVERGKYYASVLLKKV
ncbi:hypothetical protein D3C81_07300 [compost metagenome]